MADAQLPPGTTTIEDLHNSSGTIILQPTPSDDPNEPLNWSKLRKCINYGLVCFYTFATFTILDINPVTWAAVNAELDISLQNLNNSYAAGSAGLAVGSIVLIPIAIKYGRRPVYLISSLIQVASAIWLAKLNTTAEIIVVNVLSGLGGAVSEVIVQMTIADVFFVHQRATANGLYLVAVSIGVWLAPVAAGFCATAQGWRWTWWWCAIIFALNTLAFAFLYEETKYIPLVTSHPTTPAESRDTGNQDDDLKKMQSVGAISVEAQPVIALKPYRERLALITKTSEPMLRHLYQPVITLVFFPAVAYTALVYGSLFSWFSIIATAQGTYLPYPPYNFSASGVGLFNLAPFIGGVLGALYGGWLNDRWIIWMAKRNGGVFEPEMRLYLAVPAIIACPVGILMFGLGLAQGWRWIILAVGCAVFGFSFGVMGDLTLTYLTDCYKEAVGDALVAVAFIRNALGAGMVFAFTPWASALGLYNLFVSMACLGLGILLLTAPMAIWGKDIRRRTAQRYGKMAEVQQRAR